MTPARPEPPPPVLQRWVRLRLLGVAGCLSLLFLLVASRAYDLQVKQGDHYKKLAEKQHVRTVEIPAPRGAIYDATGDELAVTAESDSVFANPREVKDVAKTAQSLAKILELDIRVLESRLAAPKSFIWLKRHVTAEQAEAIKKLKLSGIVCTKEPRRFYAMGALAGPVLGFAGIDGRGLAGLELKLDQALTGRRARLAAVRDASGGFVFSEADFEAQAGASITLTLDRSVQYIAERALETTIRNNHAKAGLAVVLKVGTGEVLALANYPSLDPNHPGDALTRGARNRVVSDAYEIGSVMKVFTIAAALEARAVTPQTYIDVEGGRYQIGRKVIVDSNEDESLTVGGVLKRSSNIGAFKIARRLGKEALHQALVRYGFGQATGIELPGERSGVVHPPERWGETGLAAVSYGYNLMVTPIQAIAAFAAVGSGGVYYPPRIVKEIRDTGGAVTYRFHPEGHRIITAKVAGQLMPMLESVFDKGKEDGGTGASLNLVGFRAAGKSGTAHKVDPQSGGYSAHSYMSSFIGLAPAEKPLIAVLVIIDEPGGDQHYGALVAGPAWLDVTTETLKYLGVPLKPAPASAPAPAPEKSAPVKELPPEQPLAETPTATDPHGTWIPDFTGLGIAQALDLAAEAGLAVRIEGSGRAVSQQPEPGFSRTATECRIVFRDSLDSQ